MSMLACSSDGRRRPTATRRNAAAAPDAAAGSASCRRRLRQGRRAKLPRMQLTDCDTEQPYVLYDEAEYCPAQVVHIARGGVVKAPARRSRRLEREVNQRFKGGAGCGCSGDHQNPDRSVGTPEFCRRAWKSRYGLQPDAGRPGGACGATPAATCRARSSSTTTAASGTWATPRRSTPSGTTSRRPRRRRRALRANPLADARDLHPRSPSLAR